MPIEAQALRFREKSQFLIEVADNLEGGTHTPCDWTAFSAGVKNVEDATMAVEIVSNAGAAEQTATIDARSPGASASEARRLDLCNVDRLATDRSGPRSPAGSADASIDLYILAHQDDELFFAPLIDRSVRQGCNPRFIYTTDGTWYGVPPAVRVRETADVLRSMGVPASSIHQVGVEMGIRDGYSHLRLNELFERITELTREIRVCAIYVHAWDGGHADHDAAHLLGAALAREMDVSALFECPSYNAHRALPGLFRMMHWIPRAKAIEVRHLSLKEAVRCYGMTFRYPSQWRTFLGLSGPAFLRYVVRRRHECRRVGLVDYTAPPHAGRLLYERRFGLSFEQFRDATSLFVASRLGPIGAPIPGRKETRVA